MRRRRHGHHDRGALLDRHGDRAGTGRRTLRPAGQALLRRARPARRARRSSGPRSSPARRPSSRSAGCSAARSGISLPLIPQLGFGVVAVLLSACCWSGRWSPGDALRPASRAGAARPVWPSVHPAFQRTKVRFCSGPGQVSARSDRFVPWWVSRAASTAWIRVLIMGFWSRSTHLGGIHAGRPSVLIRQGSSRGPKSCDGDRYTAGSDRSGQSPRRRPTPGYGAVRNIAVGARSRERSIRRRGRSTPSFAGGWQSAVWLRPRSKTAPAVVSTGWTMSALLANCSSFAVGKKRAVTGPAKTDPVDQVVGVDGDNHRRRDTAGIGNVPGPQLPVADDLPKASWLRCP